MILELLPDRGSSRGRHGRHYDGQFKKMTGWTGRLSVKKDGHFGKFRTKMTANKYSQLKKREMNSHAIRF